MKRLILHDPLFESLFPYDLHLSKGTNNCLSCLSHGFSSHLAIPWESAFIAGNGMEILFSRIDSSSLSISSHCILSVYLFSCSCQFFISIIFFKSVTWNLFSQIPIPNQLPWFRFWISYGGFGINLFSKLLWSFIFCGCRRHAHIFFMVHVWNKTVHRLKKIASGLIKKLLWLNWIKFLWLDWMNRVLTKLN